MKGFQTLSTAEKEDILSSKEETHRTKLRKAKELLNLMDELLPETDTIEYRKRLEELAED